MTGGFDVDLATLRRSAGDLLTVADRFAGELQQLVGKLSAVDDPFGSDLIGGLIGEAYVEVVDYAMEQFGVMLEDLGYFAQGLGDMADSYELVDTGSAADFDAIQDGL